MLHICLGIPPYIFLTCLPSPPQVSLDKQSSTAEDLVAEVAQVKADNLLAKERLALKEAQWEQQVARGKQLEEGLEQAQVGGGAAVQCLLLYLLLASSCMALTTLVCMTD
jgi:hypothetical protein